ncbi:uncharacterized protein DEA37_0011595 [Paragonimus westermani]|uniref:Bromodomain adjacent to zinc finger domain protein 2B n=1 Tax=Paragonimus westermani TaxID=34504 RepID=A0A5J4P1V7_9TREM|nr:uncharacterized protein DEA37_0011595 [Paragonimus westermani]
MTSQTRNSYPQPSGADSTNDPTSEGVPNYFGLNYAQQAALLWANAAAVAAAASSCSPSDQDCGTVMQRTAKPVSSCSTLNTSGMDTFDTFIPSKSTSTSHTKPSPKTISKENKSGKSTPLSSASTFGNSLPCPNRLDPAAMMMASLFGAQSSDNRSKDLSAIGLSALQHPTVKTFDQQPSRKTDHRSTDVSKRSDDSDSLSGIHTQAGEALLTNQLLHSLAGTQMSYQRQVKQHQHHQQHQQQQQQQQTALMLAAALSRESGFSGFPPGYLEAFVASLVGRAGTGTLDNSSTSAVGKVDPSTAMLTAGAATNLAYAQAMMMAMAAAACGGMKPPSSDSLGQPSLPPSQQQQQAQSSSTLNYDMVGFGPFGSATASSTQCGLPNAGSLGTSCEPTESFSDVLAFLSQCLNNPKTSSDRPPVCQRSFTESKGHTTSSPQVHRRPAVRVGSTSRTRGHGSTSNTMSQSTGIGAAAVGTGTSGLPFWEQAAVPSQTRHRGRGRPPKSASSAVHYPQAHSKQSSQLGLGSSHCRLQSESDTHHIQAPSDTIASGNSRRPSSTTSTSDCSVEDTIDEVLRHLAACDHDPALVASRYASSALGIALNRKRKTEYSLPAQSSPTSISISSETMGYRGEQITKRPRTGPTAESGLRLPLALGWRRETLVKGIGPGGILGEVIYVTPCGRRLWNLDSVREYLKSNNVNLLSVDDFSFKSYLRLGDYYECSRTGHAPQSYVKMSDSALDALTSAGLTELDDLKSVRSSNSSWAIPAQFDLNKDYHVNSTELNSLGTARSSSTNLNNLVSSQSSYQNVVPPTAHVHSSTPTKLSPFTFPPSSYDKSSTELAFTHFLNPGLNGESLCAPPVAHATNDLSAKSSIPLQLFDPFYIPSSLNPMIPSFPFPVSSSGSMTVMDNAWSSMNRAMGLLPSCMLGATGCSHLEPVVERDCMKNFFIQLAREQIRLDVEKRAQRHSALLEEREHNLALEVRGRVEYELKKPVDDLRLLNSKKLPELEPIPGNRFSGQAFAHCLVVIEFLHAFTEILCVVSCQGLGKLAGVLLYYGFKFNTDSETIPTLGMLQSALVDRQPDCQQAVLHLLIELLKFAILDPGLPSSRLVTQLLGQRFSELEVNANTVTGLLRVFLIGRNGHEDHMSDWLHPPCHFLDLSGDQQAALLAFVCDELVCSSRLISTEVDRTIELQAVLKREKWVLESKIRRLRFIMVRKFGASLSTENVAVDGLPSGSALSKGALIETNVASMNTTEAVDSSMELQCGADDEMLDDRSQSPGALLPDDHNEGAVMHSHLDKHCTNSVSKTHQSKLPVFFCGPSVDSDQSGTQEATDRCVNSTGPSGGAAAPNASATAAASVSAAAVANAFLSGDEEEVEDMGQLEARIETLSKVVEYKQKAIEECAYRLSGLYLGQDRYYRKYYVLGHLGGIYIQGNPTNSLSFNSSESHVQVEQMADAKSQNDQPNDVLRCEDPQLGFDPEQLVAEIQSRRELAEKRRYKINIPTGHGSGTTHHHHHNHSHNHQSHHPHNGNHAHQQPQHISLSGTIQHSPFGSMQVEANCALTPSVEPQFSNEVGTPHILDQPEMCIVDDLGAPPTIRPDTVEDTVPLLSPFGSSDQYSQTSQTATAADHTSTALSEAAPFDSIETRNHLTGARFTAGLSEQVTLDIDPMENGLENETVKDKASLENVATASELVITCLTGSLMKPELMFQLSDETTTSQLNPISNDQHQRTPDVIVTENELHTSLILNGVHASVNDNLEVDEKGFNTDCDQENSKTVSDSEALVSGAEPQPIKVDSGEPAKMETREKETFHDVPIKTEDHCVHTSNIIDRTDCDMTNKEQQSTSDAGCLNLSISTCTVGESSFPCVEQSGTSQPLDLSTKSNHDLDSQTSTTFVNKLLAPNFERVPENAFEFIVSMGLDDVVLTTAALLFMTHTSIIPASVACSETLFEPWKSIIAHYKSILIWALMEEMRSDEALEQPNYGSLDELYKVGQHSALLSTPNTLRDAVLILKKSFLDDSSFVENIQAGSKTNSSGSISPINGLRSNDQLEAVMKISDLEVDELADRELQTRGVQLPQTSSNLLRPIRSTCWCCLTDPAKLKELIQALAARGLRERNLYKGIKRAEELVEPSLQTAANMIAIKNDGDDDDDDDGDDVIDCSCGRTQLQPNVNEFSTPTSGTELDRKPRFLRVRSRRGKGRGGSGSTAQLLTNANNSSLPPVNQCRTGFGLLSSELTATSLVHSGDLYSVNEQSHTAFFQPSVADITEASEDGNCLVSDNCSTGQTAATVLEHRLRRRVSQHSNNQTELNGSLLKSVVDRLEKRPGMPGSKTGEAQPNGRSLSDLVGSGDPVFVAECCLLEEVEALEDRVLNASLQMKGWQAPVKVLDDETVHLIPRTTPKRSRFEHWPLDLARSRLLGLESHLERRYLLPPLNSEVHLDIVPESDSFIPNYGTRTLNPELPDPETESESGIGGGPGSESTNTSLKEGESGSANQTHHPHIIRRVVLGKQLSNTNEPANLSSSYPLGIGYYSADIQDSSNYLFGSYSVEQLPPGLIEWRHKLHRATEIDTMRSCLEQLVGAIAWEKSIMKVSGHPLLWIGILERLGSNASHATLMLDHFGISVQYCLLKAPQLCQICRRDNNEAQLLLCDGCDHGYHTYCFRPPLVHIPQGDWFCYDCVSKATGKQVCFVCGGTKSNPAVTIAPVASNAGTTGTEPTPRLLICDCCSRAVHPSCARPPMTRLPRRWYCANCVANSSNSCSSKSQNNKAGSTAALVTFEVPSGSSCSSPSNRLVRKTDSGSLEPNSIDHIGEQNKDAKKRNPSSKLRKSGTKSSRTPLDSTVSKGTVRPSSLTIRLNKARSIGTEILLKLKQQKKNRTHPQKVRNNDDRLTGCLFSASCTKSAGSRRPTHEHRSSTGKNGISALLDRNRLENNKIDVQGDRMNSSPSSRGSTTCCSSYTFDREDETPRRMMTPSEISWCRMVTEDLINHEASWAFRKPVNLKQVPFYKKIIKHPMDLSTIYRKTRHPCAYSSVEKWYKDVRLIFDNCEIFNEDDSEVGRAGHTMRAYFESRWSQPPSTVGVSDTLSANSHLLSTNTGSQPIDQAMACEIVPETNSPDSPSNILLAQLKRATTIKSSSGIISDAEEFDDDKAASRTSVCDDLINDTHESIDEPIVLRPASTQSVYSDSRSSGFSGFEQNEYMIGLQLSDLHSPVHPCTDADTVQPGNHNSDTMPTPSNSLSDACLPVTSSPLK